MALEPNPHELVTLMTGSEAVEYPASIIFEVIDLYRRHDLEGALRALLQPGPSGELKIRLPPDTVNALKIAVASDPALRDDPTAELIMNPPKQIEGLDPFSRRAGCCGFSSGN